MRVQNNKTKNKTNALFKVCIKSSWSKAMSLTEKKGV